ncbi:hypothetical protein ACOSQ2_005312 [Xanthoceras sorbifolium]
MLSGTAVLFVKFDRIAVSRVAVAGSLELLRWIFSCSVRLGSLWRIYKFLLLFFGRIGAFVIVLHDRPSLAFSLSRFIRWIPPITGGFKLNTDAALDFKNLRTDLGAVVRDHLGKLVLSGMTSFTGLLSPAVAEAKAILFGLLMAFEGGFSKMSLNSDAAS